MFLSIYVCLFLFISVQPQTQPLLHIPAQVASTPASSTCFRDYYNTKTCMNIFFQQGLCYDESGPARGAKVRKGIKGEALISAGARHGAKVRGREAPARARRARRQQGPPEERAQGSGRIKRARRAQKKTPEGSKGSPSFFGKVWEAPVPTKYGFPHKHAWRPPTPRATSPSGSGRTRRDPI